MAIKNSTVDHSRTDHVHWLLSLHPRLSIFPIKMGTQPSCQVLPKDNIPWIFLQDLLEDALTIVMTTR